MLTSFQQAHAKVIGHNMKVAVKDGNRNMLAAWANVANNFASNRIDAKVRPDFVSAVYYAFDTASV